MADFNINHITGKQGQQGTVLAGVTTVSSTGSMRIPSGPTDHRGGRGRAVFGGGYTPSATNTLNFIEIATTGNASGFGDLSVVRKAPGGCASSTRGLIFGGYTIKSIDYVTMSSQGGVSDFGDLQKTSNYSGNALSNNIRGIYGSSEGTALNPDRIEYVTIATTGDASEFGRNIFGAPHSVTGTEGSERGYASAASPTRGLFAGGHRHMNAVTNIISYITIATLGNNALFGNLTVARNGPSGCSNSTRAIWSGGATSPTSTNVQDTIDYTTIATLGDATDFGNLTAATSFATGAASSTRGVIAGGHVAPSGNSTVNTIEYVTISSLGNATNFGDLTEAIKMMGGCSDVHGGLGE